jgi:hypothetical protein
MTATAIAPGLELVRLRPILAGPILAWFPLRPGERALVTPGEAVVRGAPLAERVREPRTEVVDAPSTAEPGSWWVAPPGRRRRGGADQGELLFRSGGRWRLGTGEHAEPLEAPFAGIVRDVTSGSGLTLQSPARALVGADVLAGSSAGRLRRIAARDGHVRASEIDVGAAGTILVVGSHVDAEAITRARALGVRGIVVAGLGVKERQEVMASERRGRAGIHGLPPFGVLVLDGAVGRPIATPVLAVLDALEGRTVAIVDEPACLVIDDPDVDLPEAAPGIVRVTGGPLAGAEGMWAGLAGSCRFAGGVHLEAGLVRLGGRAPVAIPLGDLERFA